tara:strand:+ start:446 stop:1939 length:1494 start_codon:yes stop_codon:yes gene_type:complete
MENDSYTPYMRTQMPTSLLDAMTSGDTRTLNDCVTHSTSSSPLVDLFFTINTFRHKEEDEIQSAFYRAYNHSPVDALRILFYSRDIRGGQGERRTFRLCLKSLAQSGQKLQGLLQYIPYFGRWDDVLVFLGTPLENEALALIKQGLDAEDGLCAKWMPREKSSKSAQATTIRRFLGLTPKQYRKKLSQLTNVVETQMCSKNWDAIQYGHVPSRATLLYRNAFEKHSPKRWHDFLTSVVEGEDKVNAGTLYPHDVVKPIWDTMGDTWGGSTRKPTVDELTLLDEQWKALPNYMESNSERVLPVVDTSGSMYSGGNPEPILVSVSLGLYIAERNEGPFKDHFVTFSDTPSLQKVEGNSVMNRLASLKGCDWGYNTNIERVFKLVLDSAVKSNVSESEMPSVILILSDMEFDSSSNCDVTAFEQAKQLYAAAGYELPKIVFWNLDAKTSNFPVKFHETGTAMVSGFSPTILKQILAGGDMSPEKIMFDVINSERYSCITL